MDVFDDKEIAKEEELDDDSDFRIFLEKQPIGIAVVHEGYRDIEGSVAQPDSGDFVKWVRANKPDINIDVPTYDKQLVLRSNDYWLPLVFLASDITLPIYLNLVANYLYDKSKGLLKGETQRVHLSAVYQDTKNGINKKFLFEGDSESLKKAIKRFDLNEFME